MSETTWAYYERLHRESCLREEQLKQQLEELKKDSLALAEFYGDRASYVAKQYRDSDTVFVKNDSEISNTSGLYEGGKRAREFLAKYRGDND